MRLLNYAQHKMNMPGSDSIADSRALHAPVAMVGMGCRFPGGANDPDTFWRLLENGVDAITEVPDDRWNRARFFDAKRGKPGRSHSQWGGFVDHLDQFDAQFFGISPREAARMDPQQRLLLEVAWEAIEDAGQPLERMSGNRTSVFTGISSWEYAHQALSFQDRGVITPYTNTGGSLSIAANRISYCFDLRGPSVTVDTACSSALVALHLACQSIWNEGCQFALAGGVNALLAPDSFIAFSQLGMLSPDGRCKAFDARGDGFVRSEGAGMVLLKPLEQALADGDRIYAVVRGTALNQDGRTPGMTVPRQEAQEVLIREACRNAGVSPAWIQYVEAHGTGTPVGDPIEARALGSVLGDQRPVDQPCWIGSVKTNIGHLESAAGIASVLKAALALYHRRIPGNLHFQEPNTEIDFQRLRLRVPVQCEPWPRGDQPRLAGINGFGYGGTNAHVIVQEAPSRHNHTPLKSDRDLRPFQRQSSKHGLGLGPDRELVEYGIGKESAPAPQSSSDDSTRRAQVVPLSARSAEALRAVAGSLPGFIDQLAKDSTLAELAGTLAHRRSHHEHRAAIVTESMEDLVGQLATLADGRLPDAAVSNRCLPGRHPRVAFVCSGQGPQWWAMGRQLLETEPVFRDVIQRCDAFSRSRGQWSLMEELLAGEANSRLAVTAIAQPAIFALQVALAELWRSWGVVPEAVTGHSVGEVAAAYIAGVFTLEEAFHVVYHRGRCMERAPSRGRMLAAGLTVDEAERLVAEYGDEVTVAAINGPASVTLSGEAAPLQAIAEQLEQSQVFCRELRVEYAFHSNQMEPIRDDLLEALCGLAPKPAQLPLVSTVTGDRVVGSELGPEYWWRNVRHRVRFADAVDRIASAGYDTVLELSPHPVLAYGVTECYQRAGTEVRVLPSLRRDEPESRTMLRSAAVLHTIGYPLEWSRLAPKPQRFLRLPAYPWQRQSCWFESPESRRSRLQSSVHPLLGVSQGGPRPSWQNRLDVRLTPYLGDHRVQKLTVLPATAYLEMALAACGIVDGLETSSCDNLKLLAPCLLTSEDGLWIETRYDPDTRKLQVHGRSSDNDQSWVLHSEATLHAGVSEPAETLFAPDEIRARCREEFTTQACYGFFQKLGLDYGPAFQGIVQGWRRPGESLGVVQLPAAAAVETDWYLVHPALLDACFQLMLPADEDFLQRAAGLYLPYEIDRVRFYRRPGPRAWCHVRSSSKTSKRMQSDLDIYNEEGLLALEIRGLRCQRVNGTHGGTSPDELLYKYVWQAKALAGPTGRQRASGNGKQTEIGHWLVLADRSGVGRQLASELRSRGQDVTIVSTGDRFHRAAQDHYRINPAAREDVVRLLQSVLSDERPPCRGIVHLWSLDAPQAAAMGTSDLEAAQLPGVLSALYLVQAWDEVAGDAAAQLMLVTRGAQSVGNQPEATGVAQSPLIGFGRVVVSEYAKLTCKMVDLDPQPAAGDGQMLLDELWGEDDEDEVAMRGSARYAHRYQPCTDDNDALPADAGDVPYRLSIRRPGTMDDLRMRTACRQAPAAGEVEIQVQAAGLNFSDVMKVLGLYPGLKDGPIPLGAECSGVVTRVGPGVDEFELNERVLAVAPFSFGSHVVTRADLIARLPAELTFEQAATVPIAFLTAWYALVHLGRLRAGETVLIHSASGGVGQAAVQIARHVGAGILATAGTEEKRAFLAQQGIEHVMDSRSLDFADQVLAFTDGRGIDAILNSLAGAAIPRGLAALADYGRFLEIGKRDIYQNAHLGLSPFRNNLSFFAIDLDQVMRDRPAELGAMLQELVSAFEAGHFEPLPHRVFSVGQVSEAFRFMQQGEHIGKIVISFDRPPARIAHGEMEPLTFREDATYLITGGMGGFGLAVAHWLADRGARHVALMGRRGVHSPQAQQAIDQLESRGVRVSVLKADVSERTDVAAALERIAQAGPPLRGVIHAAMVLEDGLLLNLDRDWMQRVMAPKVSGAWNLHALTENSPLDLFVLFSSLSSVFGHAGQGNYAAANAFLDSLAHYRRANGLPALTVNWGYLGDVGYLAERQQLGARLERRGVQSFTIQEALEALELALQRRAVQLSVMRVDWSRWQGLGVSDRISPRFAHLLPASGLPDREDPLTVPSLDTIGRAVASERPGLVDRLLRHRLASLLGVAPEQLDRDAPLLDLGLDSLMAVEMRNWVESQLQIKLPVTRLMRGASLSGLTDVLCAELPTDLSSDDPASAERKRLLKANPEKLLAEIDGMSDQEVDHLLSTMLEQSDTKKP